MYSCVFWCEFVDLLNLLALFGSFSKSTVLVGNHVDWRFRILRKLYLKANLGFKKKLGWCFNLFHKFKNSLIIYKEKKNNKCLLSVSICDKNTAKLYVQFFSAKITPNLNISARMSWSISEILKPLTKHEVVHYQV